MRMFMCACIPVYTVQHARHLQTLHDRVQRCQDTVGVESQSLMYHSSQRRPAQPSWAMDRKMNSQQSIRTNK